MGARQNQNRNQRISLRGAAQKNPTTRRTSTSAPARQKRYVRAFFLFCYFVLSAHLGVSRPGDFETKGKQIDYVSKTNPREEKLRGIFSFFLLLLLWLSASR
jgi:hypothetical protein